MSTALRRSREKAQIPSAVGDTFIPMAPSFRASISMCSSRGPTSEISPPAIPQAMSSVPASMRSAISSASTGTSSSTPSISIVDVPAPMIRAPMRVR